ncbi:MAG: hypothetical protein KKH04_11010 [Proteobacteria bacterium]|nr:hypothetical protein [Pseudomonadota bacterium]
MGIGDDQLDYDNPQDTTLGLERQVKVIVIIDTLKKSLESKNSLAKTKVLLEGGERLIKGQNVESLEGAFAPSFYFLLIPPGKFIRLLLEAAVGI